MASISETATRFHFGLKVADLARAVDFYRVLFDSKPVRLVDDYARFEVADPPIVLALRPGHASTGGALNHVGFRVANSEKLIDVQRRLESHGIPTQREEGVECCYALQTKFWVPDADRNLWEVYTLHEDLEHSGFGGNGQGMPPRPQSTLEPLVWSHLPTAPPPRRIPYDDGTLDEVQLEGTFNADLPWESLYALLAEAKRALKRGARISVHGLVSDAPFPGKPSLPGPAAMVRSVPVETEPLRKLRLAGFVGMFYERLGDIHCFSVDGIELRELQLVGFKPFSDIDGATRFVMYRGPLSQLTDDGGRAYHRGYRVAVDTATWQLYRRPPFHDQFVCFPCTTESGAESV